MRNYYFILSFNPNHATVKKLFKRIGIERISKSLVDMKIRSRSYLTEEEATSKANEDFKLKLPDLYPDLDRETQLYSIYMVANPMHELEERVGESVAEALQAFRVARWDEDCCRTMFFAELPLEGEDFPREWMVKYEIFYVDDEIEFMKNGENIFNPMQVSPNNFSSAYH